MLVPAGIAAVRIALRVPDENGDVRVVHIFVQDHMVAVRRKAQIDQMLVILAVMAGDLAGIIELAEQILSQNCPHLRYGRTGMQPIRKQQQDVLFLYARGV